MIKIITDSTAYIPSEYLQENDIKVIPLRVLFKEEEFDEGLPGSYHSFFEVFTKEKVFPKTSQPSLIEFTNMYNEIIANGDEAIVYTISSSLSARDFEVVSKLFNLFFETTSPLPSFYVE